MGFIRIKMKSNNVVAAIIRNDNKYLIVQRNRNKHLGLKWEFPGGKVNQNETFKEALLREIKEELSYQLENPNFFFQWYNPETNTRIFYFLVEI